MINSDPRHEIRDEPSLITGHEAREARPETVMSLTCDWENSFLQKKSQVTTRRPTEQAGTQEDSPWGPGSSVQADGSEPKFDK